MYQTENYNGVLLDFIVEKWGFVGFHVTWEKDKKKLKQGR